MKPIETAPKINGLPTEQWPLLYCPDRAGGQLIIGRWVQTSARNTGVWADINKNIINPTHWISQDEVINGKTEPETVEPPEHVDVHLAFDANDGSFLFADDNRDDFLSESASYPAQVNSVTVRVKTERILGEQFDIQP